jgi:hypothetical protein
MSLQDQLNRIEDKLDGRLGKLEDTFVEHAKSDEKRFGRLEKMLLVLFLMVASPKLGGPDAASLVAHVVSSVRS